MVASSRKPHRFKRKKPIYKYRFFWVIILALLLTGILLYGIVFARVFQVKQIEVAGNQKVQRSSIRNKVSDSIPRTLGPLSSRSIFLADIQSAKNKLLKNFPHLKEISIDRDFPDRLVVRVEEREPKALFEYDQQLYLVDKKGVVFEKNPKNEINFVVKNLNLNQQPELGQKVFDQQKITDILTIESQLENLKRAVLVSDRRLNVTTRQGWEAYFNLEEDVEWQVEQLKLVLEQELSPSEIKGLDYIDLRFRKIFIK